MATKTSSKSSAGRKTAGATKRSKPGTRRSAPRQAAAENRGGARTGAGNASAGRSDSGPSERYKKLMTPEQAFELYRQNARLALDIIDAALESTAKMRKLQFQGEEEARALHKKAARHATEAENPQALAAASQNVGEEAVQKAMAYWTQMFDLVVEMQKRLFALMDDQMAGVPGMQQAKAAMAMLPDLRQAQNLVTAMQGVLSSGAPAFESMQRMMGDFTRMTQHSMRGMKR